MECCERRRAFGGSSVEYLARDSEAEQDFACHQEESCEELPRDACAGGESHPQRPINAGGDDRRRFTSSATLQAAERKATEEKTISDGFRAISCTVIKLHLAVSHMCRVNRRSRYLPCKSSQSHTNASLSRLRPRTRTRPSHNNTTSTNTQRG